MWKIFYMLFSLVFPTPCVEEIIPKLQNDWGKEKISKLSSHTTVSVYFNSILFDSGDYFLTTIPCRTIRTIRGFKMNPSFRNISCSGVKIKFKRGKLQIKRPLQLSRWMMMKAWTKRRDSRDSSKEMSTKLSHHWKR